MWHTRLVHSSAVVCISTQAFLLSMRPPLDPTSPEAARLLEPFGDLTHYRSPAPATIFPWYQGLGATAPGGMKPASWWKLSAETREATAWADTTLER